jgi:restriction endonuclease S subunit
LKYKSEGGTPALNAVDLKKIECCIPPLSEQQRIVSILDTFEASVRNLEQQLAQREKQYEYYRNKLLTFE